MKRKITLSAALTIALLAVSAAGLATERSSAPSTPLEVSDYVAVAQAGVTTPAAAFSDFDLHQDRADLSASDCDASPLGFDASPADCKRGCNKKCNGAPNKSKCVGACRRACDS